MSVADCIAPIRRFIETGEGDFWSLARALYAAQLQDNPVYAAVSGGVRPERIEAIPAVPVSLFQELSFTCAPITPATVVFRTSGTTTGRRGVHYLQDTALYELGARRHFLRCVPDAPLSRVVSLCPPGGGDSSLGHMVDDFAQAPPVHAFDPDRGLLPEVWSFLQDGPLFLATTAFSLDALLSLPGRADLDPRSLVMVTGGFKGRKVRLDAAALYEALPARLGQPRVVGEYGMTELSSQLWTEPVPAGVVPGAFRAPPWLYVYTVDPTTGEPAEEGLLRFVDLCNVWSVLAIETMDVGRVARDADGHQQVTLLGRLSGAELRGCSLRMEELSSRVER